MCITRVIGRIIGKTHTTKSIKPTQQNIKSGETVIKDEIRTFFPKVLDGSTQTRTIRDSEIDKINEENARILQKAGIIDINDPKYGKYALYDYDDAWNPSHKK